MSDLPPIDMNVPLIRSEKFLFAEIDKDKVMIDLDSEAYYGLNEVAGEIWDLLNEARTPAEICAELQMRFEVDAETCQAETQAVLGRMLRLKLIKASNAATA